MPLSRSYSVTLHTLLVAMAAVNVVLVLQNHQLKNPPAPQPSLLEPGDTVTTQPMLDLSGNPATLTWDQSQQRDRMLFVYTTTCPACRENQAAWRALYTDLAEHVDVVGVSLDGLDAARVYHAEHGLPYPVVVPADRQQFSQVFEISAVPLTLHISPSGEVRNAWLGGLTAERLHTIESMISPSGDRG